MILSKNWQLFKNSFSVFGLILDVCGLAKHSLELIFIFSAKSMAKVDVYLIH